MIVPKGVAEQVAALPVRWDRAAPPRMLMVSSRDTGRWVMPKGWLMDGKKPWHAARIEALEEAGAVGYVSDRPIGVYRCEKRLDSCITVQCRITVYPMVVDRLKRRWKERKERKRRWFSFRKAARLVDERELSDLLNGLARNPERLMMMEGRRMAS